MHLECSFVAKWWFSVDLCSKTCGYSLICWVLAFSSIVGHLDQSYFGLNHYYSMSKQWTQLFIAIGKSTKTLKNISRSIEIQIAKIHKIAVPFAPSARTERLLITLIFIFPRRNASRWNRLDLSFILVPTFWSCDLCEPSYDWKRGATLRKNELFSEFLHFAPILGTQIRHICPKTVIALRRNDENNEICAF